MDPGGLKVFRRLNINDSLVLVYDSVDRGQSKAMPLVLGREKRLKNLGDHFRPHTTSIVSDLQDRVFPDLQRFWWTIAL